MAMRLMLRQPRPARTGGQLMTECALCGDYESEHEETSPGSRYLGRCRKLTMLSPPTKLVPEGGYESCDCPGYEPEPENDDELVRCLCSGESIPAERAYRTGCDQPGGCPELRASVTEAIFDA